MARPFNIQRKISRNFIRKQLRETTNPRLKERLQALLWFTDGSSCTEIAGKINRCRQVVADYIKTYDQHGIAKLAIIGRGPGRQNKLNVKQREQVLKWIDTSPRDLGYGFNNWDCKKLSYEIERKFDISISSEQVRKMLHKMKCVLLRPRHKLLQADPAVILKKNGRFAGLWVSHGRKENMLSCLKTK